MNWFVAKTFQVEQGFSPNKDILKKKFLDFFYDDLTPVDFDKWICNKVSLEKIVGEDLYYQLISTDYSKLEDLTKIKSSIDKSYNDLFSTDLCSDRVVDILNKMLDGNIKLPYGCTLLWELKLEGADFIPSVFAGYATELENKKQELFYHDRLINDTKELLSKLTKSTGQSDTVLEINPKSN